MNYHLEQAELLARAETWESVSPSQLLSLIQDRGKRVVETDEQLVSVIMESLDRLQAKLHDELPAVRDLWNSKGSKFWPKDEQDVSDYIVRHLKEDLRERGIIVNREVQIRRGTGDGTGQSTDIHVDAVDGGHKRLAAIIEVKGNWNPELSDAMRTQLRDRYLKDNSCKNGIYLVGWFSHPKWAAAGDYRENQCPRMSLTEAKGQFAQQASQLSKDGYLIKSHVLDLSLS
jgi:hypothetical protein